MLKKDFLEQHDNGVTFYKVYSDIGMDVLQVETDNVYGEVAITDDEPYTYADLVEV